MAGEKFQGFNYPDFRKSVDLHIIESRPEMHLQEIDIDQKKTYKYVRYIGPKNGYSDVVELEFHGTLGKVEGKIIGQAKWSIIADAFDGNIDSFFATAPSIISKIKFLPRCDNNEVMKADLHELLYWDSSGWVSLGKKKAEDWQLTYVNVPKNTLL